jgi:uncharacterized protein YndB with AHSA1/START domain
MEPIMTVTHDTFIIERHFGATPERVFTAFADSEAKVTWFQGPAEWRTPEYTFDFRVGGHETNIGGPKEGAASSFEATYLDIVPNERIIYSYVMHLDERKISASLATIEIAAEGSGSKLTLTEHGGISRRLRQSCMAQARHRRPYGRTGSVAPLAGRTGNYSLTRVLASGS